MERGLRAEIPAVPPYSSLKPAPCSTRPIHDIASLLGTTLRLTVPSTSRQFIGTFVCIDPQGNLVLDQAREWEIDLDGDTQAIHRRKGEGRDVGLVLVKREIWGHVERLRTEEERIRDAQRNPNGCNPS
ncbi:hypothetical protein JCM16303_002342 [Sporobolomyces ruberrimus]